MIFVRYGGVVRALALTTQDVFETRVSAQKRGSRPYLGSSRSHSRQKSLATGVAPVKRFLKTNNKIYENKSGLTLDIVKSRV